MGLKENHDIILESKQTEEISLNILTENEREQIKKLHKTYSFGSIFIVIVAYIIVQRRLKPKHKNLKKTILRVHQMSFCLVLQSCD